MSRSASLLRSLALVGLAQALLGAAPSLAQDAADPGELGPQRGGAQDQQEVRLIYQFDQLDGHVATYRIQTKLTQSKRVEGRVAVEDDQLRRPKGGAEKGQGEVVSTTRQTYELRFEKGERGLGKVFMTPTRVEAELEENGKVAYRFDSKDHSAPPEHLADVARRAAPLTNQLGKTAVMTVTRQGVVKSVRGVKLSERKAYKANFHELPSKRLRIGRGWEQKTKQPIPPFGNLHYFTSFRLSSVKPAPKGASGQRIRVDAKLLVTYEGVGPTASSRMRLTKQEGGGHLVFDERGLLVEEKLNSTVELSIKAVAGSEVHTVKSQTVRWLSAFRKAE